MSSDWLARLAAWLPPWPLAAAAAAGLLALAVVAGVIKHVGIRRVAVAVAGTIGIITSAEGMWIVAGKLPGVSGVWQAIPAILFESAMLATAARAREHHKDHQHVGRFGPRMWMFGTAAGIIAGFAGVTVATVLLRFAAPMVAAAVVLDEFPDERDGADEREPITWKLGLRRLAVRFGFAKDGTHKISDEERDRRTNKLAIAADRFHHGWRWSQRWRRFRLRRLARYADDPMVNEVRVRVQRINRIERSTAPDDGPAGEELSPEVVELCEQVRFSARAARSRLFPSPAVTLGHVNGSRPVAHAVAGRPVQVPSAVAAPLNGAPAGNGEATSEPPAPAKPARAPAKRTGRRAARKATSAQTVTGWLADHPGYTVKDAAAALGISPRTAFRRLEQEREQQEGSS